MIKRLKDLLFQNRGARQTIAKNVFWLSVSQVGSRLIRAVIIIYAARVLGAAEYGIFSYVLGFAGLFTIFGDVGINNLLTRNVAAHPEKRNEYFSSSFWVKIFLLLTTSLLVIFVAPHLTNIEKAKSLIPLVAFLVVFEGLREIVIAFLRGLEKMEWEAFLVIIMNITIVIAGFIILSISPTSRSFIFSYIASVGVTAVLAIIILKNQFLKIFGFFKKTLAVQIIKDAWPIALSATLAVFLINTDIVMLGWWRTAEEIGYYSAGQRIIGVLYTLPALFASGIFPTLSRFVKQNENQKVKDISEKLITITFLMAIPLVIGGVILSQPIINLVFGQEYLPAVPAFQILLVNLLIVFSGPFVSNFILAHNHQKNVVGYVAVGAIGNVIFNALLIPPYGIVGSAIATIISYSLYYGLTWRWIKKTSDIQILVYLKKIIATAIIMGIFSFTLNQFDLNVIINIIISTGIYFGMLLLLKENSLKEIMLLFKKI